MLFDERHQTAKKDDDTLEMQAIYQAAFEFIAEYVKDSIIDKCNVERMTMQKREISTPYSGKCTRFLQ